MSNTLTSQTVSGTYHQLLHIGTGSASVATVRTGTGTATALEFVSGGAKINGTFEATSHATLGGNLTVTGSITAKGVPVLLSLTADVDAPTNTNVAITGFDFTPVAGASYAIEMHLIARSAATGTGVRIANTSGVGTLVLAEAGSSFGMDGTGTTYAPTSAPVATTNFGIALRGIFTASTSAPLSFALLSEVAASQVTLKAGSILKITRIS